MIVHNVTDRIPSKEGARALSVGGTLLRPGKNMEINEAKLPQKIRALHGTLLWFGDLPQHLRAPAPKAVAGVNPMNQAEINEYLERLSVAELQGLAERISPPLLFSGREPKVVLIQRLSGMLGKADRVLDPEAFFWLRRWTREGDSFVERG